MFTNYEIKSLIGVGEYLNAIFQDHVSIHFQDSSCFIQVGSHSLNVEYYRNELLFDLSMHREERYLMIKKIFFWTRKTEYWKSDWFNIGFFVMGCE